MIIANYVMIVAFDLFDLLSTVFEEDNTIRWRYRIYIVWYYSDYYMSDKILITVVAYWRCRGGRKCERDISLVFVCIFIEIRRCNMVSNETTIHQSPNDAD